MTTSNLPVADEHHRARTRSRSLPRIGVAVCAYTLQRWPELCLALGEAAAQGPDELLLVIDHNDELAERARAELVPAIAGLRVVANRQRRGLSGARNTAVAELTSDVVVFLDDDAVPEPDWLASLTEPLTTPLTTLSADAAPGADRVVPMTRVVSVGGAAEPVWPSRRAGRPLTLPAAPHARGELDWVVGCSYAGQPDQQAPVRNVMGCSMAFRRDAVLAVGGFAEQLGRVRNLPLGCEETELCLRLTAADPHARILFEPRARVRHHVSPDRTRWRYLLRRCWSEGRSKAAVARLAGTGPALSTERSYLTAVLPAALRRELAALVRGSSRRASAGRAAALVVGPTATVLGYLRGRLG